MDSLSFLPAVTPATEKQQRPNRKRMCKSKWRDQALNRLFALAQRIGLTKPKLLALAGVPSFEELNLKRISLLTDELGGWNNSWD